MTTLIDHGLVGTKKKLEDNSTRERWSQSILRNLKRFQIDELIDVLIF